MLDVNEIYKKRIIWEGDANFYFQSTYYVPDRYSYLDLINWWQLMPDWYFSFKEEETKDQRHQTTCQRSKVADVQFYLTPKSPLPLLDIKLPKAAIPSDLLSNFIYLSLICTAYRSVICITPQVQLINTHLRLGKHVHHWFSNFICGELHYRKN